jgi:hypothetical protein
MERIELQPDALGFKSSPMLQLNNSEGVRINNVLGVNKDGQLPARFLSGVLPTFSLSQAMMESSNGLIVPQIRIFRPISIFQHTNGISHDVVTGQTSQGNEILQHFQQNFFPEAELLIEEDLKIDQDALTALNYVRCHVEQHCDRETVAAIRESGSKHGGIQGEENALLYAAHHPFGWNGLHHQGIFPSLPPDVVINTLPPSERKFTNVRMAVAPHIITAGGITVFEGLTHELVINMSGTPHYQFLEDDNIQRQEPSFDEIRSVPVIEVFNDMQSKYSNATDKFMKEKLRRIRADMKNLLDFLTHGKLEERGSETLPGLLGKGATSV